MKIWIFTTKEVLEYLKLDEDDKLKRAAPIKTKKDDIILIYRGQPHSNIKFIFKAKTDAFKNPDFREDWDIAIDLYEKIELKNPIEFSDMKDDPILSKWSIVRKNFMGSFFDMPSKEWDRLKTLIIEKNPELKNQIINLAPDENNSDNIDQKWTFAINKDFYFDLKEQDEITWNSAKEVKKDNLIMIYSGAPYSSIGFILTSLTDPFEDPEIRKYWDRPAVNVRKLLEINSPITLQELRDNPILSQWSAVRMGFRGSHFKMSEEEFSELMGLILDKNPEQRKYIEVILENHSINESTFIVGWGRAHIVRDICYLVNENPSINEDVLFNLLRDKVGDNGNYWKAYYQRANKQTSPKINLASARNLKLIKPNILELTDWGCELVKNVTPNELYTHHYSLSTKQFYFNLAVQNPSIKTAMQILKDRNRLRFYAPTCDLTGKVIRDYGKRSNEYICKVTKHSECDLCDKDLLNHIKDSSLPFETDKKVKQGGGYVFWMCSRVTPMHLTGKDPGYSGNTIYWDKEAANELGDLIKMLDEEKAFTPRIWKITPGEPEKSEVYWPIYNKTGFIGIGWIEIKRDFREFESQNDLEAAFYDIYGESKSQSAKMIWDFTNEVKVGDYVIANRGYNKVIGIGVIQSEYIGPDDPENLNLSEYPNLRKVDWKIIDEIEVSQKFDRKTVTELDVRRWNDIISAYARMNPDFKKELLEKIYNEFKEEYLNTNVGQEHLKSYADESDKVRKAYNDVINKRNENIDVTDEILYDLVPHKGKSIVGFISNIKAFFEKTYEIKPKKFPEIANNYFETIHNFLETNDSEIQEEILNNFTSSEYSKGFAAGTLTPILFFINPNYPLVNNKTVDTVSFLSKIIGETIKLDMELNHYVENKDKLNVFLTNLSDYIPDIYDFAIFDIFCHWLCDNKLGFYAKGKPLPLLGSAIKISEFEPVFLKPELIETKLKIASKIKEQVCGTLNSSKHVMLTGAPGTGKTNLAEDVCKVAENHKFTKGYVLTTATSDWTTFDTIGGYMPNESGRLVFEEGKFLQAIKEDKWLIIDEINRADIDKAFGQLFTVLSGQGVELPFKNNGKPVRIQPTDEIGSYYDSETATYRVGKNWRILSTMNVYDKDYLFEMSYAFMRRFTFIYIELPAIEEYKKLINSWCEGLDGPYIPKIHQLLEINPHREIGPAIFKDVAEYVAAREEIGSTEHILEDAILSYIMPQFEGLEKAQILEIWKILNSIFEDANEIKKRLQEISTVPLDDAK